MGRLAAVTALLAPFAMAGCGQDPAGLVLVFPSDQARMEASAATIYVVEVAAGADNCGSYTMVPEVDPDIGLVLSKQEVALNDGKPTGSLQSIPTGRETVLVKVKNSSHILFLHGCHTGNVASGDKIEITLSPTTQNNDMAPPNNDGMMPDLTTTPDMAVHNILSITTTEMRAPNRKLSGVTVTVTDSANTTASGTTDANGNTPIDVTALMAPFRITANAPTVMGYHGVVTLYGVSPSFASSSTVVMTMPIELDPPATDVANDITINVTGVTGGEAFTAYWLGTNELIADQQGPVPFTPGGTIGPLAASSAYRVAAVLTNSTLPKIATTAPPNGAGSTITYDLTASFHPFDKTLSIGVKHSGNAAYNTSQTWNARLLLPTSQSTAAIPMTTDQSFGADATVMVNVPTTPSAVQPSAVLVTEMVADGTNVHAELRHQLVGSANDSFATAVPDPPVLTVSPSPSPVPMASPLTISAPLPSGFPSSSSFVHVTIHTGTGHWHLVAPAASNTSLVVPGNILPAGTYTVDVDFVEDFTLADTTVQATLADDYTKLTRPLPQRLSRASFSLTVN